MVAPDFLIQEVKRLKLVSGQDFILSSNPIEGTAGMYGVYADGHPLPDRYTRTKGLLGFRIPSNLPDAQPEDCFFIAPDDILLVEADPKRNSHELHRAGRSPGFMKGSALGEMSVLVFSWHLWDRRPWDRNKHTLIDHYHHCLRRFEQPEHDA